MEIPNVDDSAPEATIIADLTKPNQIPHNHFDCIICTFVLHCIRDYPAVLLDLMRILKPGSVILGCVPFIMGYTPNAREFWRYAPSNHTDLWDGSAPASAVTRHMAKQIPADQ